jgi:Ser/Thr protein kinase RdoA (MazF antagonist)
MSIGLGAELEHASPAVGSEQARALATELFGLHVSELMPLPAERDSNFHLRDESGTEFALRVIHPAEDPGVTDFQTQAMVHVEAHDPTLPVPHVVRCIRDGAGDVLWETAGQPPRRVRCVTYLRGEPLYRTTATASQRANVGTLLARLDRALTGYRHPSEDHKLLWDLKRADRARELLGAVTDERRRALPEVALATFAQELKPRLQRMRFQTLHNDFNPHNILAAGASSDQIAGVIDFGDMVRGPLIQDVATASAYQLTADGHPLDGVADLVGAFHAYCPLTDDEISILPDLIATRLSLSIAITSWRAARHPGNAPYILRNAPTVWSSLERLAGLNREAAICWLRDRITPRYQ